MTLVKHINDFLWQYIRKGEDVVSGDIAIVKLILILAARFGLLPALMDRVYIYRPINSSLS